MSNSLGEDPFTRNLTHARTYGQTDRQMTERLRYEINIPFFLKEKAGITTE